MSVYFPAKKLHFLMSYESGATKRTVPESAMIQLLVLKFGVDENDLLLNWQRTRRNRPWKRFEKRTTKERVGAFICAYWWLLSNDGCHDFYEKAAPWSAAVWRAMGNEQWHAVAELLGLSHTQRADLLFTQEPSS